MTAACESEVEVVDNVQRTESFEPVEWSVVRLGIGLRVDCEPVAIGVSESRLLVRLVAMGSTGLVAEAESSTAAECVVRRSDLPRPQMPPSGWRREARAAD